MGGRCLPPPHQNRPGKKREWPWVTYSSVTAGHWSDSAHTGWPTQTASRINTDEVHHYNQRLQQNGTRRMPSRHQCKNGRSLFASSAIEALNWRVCASWGQFLAVVEVDMEYLHV